MRLLSCWTDGLAPHYPCRPSFFNHSDMPPHQFTRFQAKQAREGNLLHVERTERIILTTMDTPSEDRMSWKLTTPSPTVTQSEDHDDWTVVTPPPTVTPSTAGDNPFWRLKIRARSSPTSTESTGYWGSASSTNSSYDIPIRRRRAKAVVKSFSDDVSMPTSTPTVHSYCQHIDTCFHLFSCGHSRPCSYENVRAANSPSRRVVTTTTKCWSCRKGHGPKPHPRSPGPVNERHGKPLCCWTKYGWGHTINQLESMDQWEEGCNDPSLEVSQIVPTEEVECTDCKSTIYRERTFNELLQETHAVRCVFVVWLSSLAIHNIIKHWDIVANLSGLGLLQLPTVLFFPVGTFWLYEHGEIWSEIYAIRWFLLPILFSCLVVYSLSKI